MTCFLVSLLLLAISLKAGLWAESRWGIIPALLYFLVVFGHGLAFLVWASRPIARKESA